MSSNLPNDQAPRHPDEKEYRVVIELSHRLGGIDVPWSKPVKVIGRAWGKTQMEAQAAVANKKVMDRIRITITKVQQL